MFASIAAEKNWLTLMTDGSSVLLRPVVRMTDGARVRPNREVGATAKRQKSGVATGRAHEAARATIGAGEEGLSVRSGDTCSSTLFPEAAHVRVFVFRVSYIHNMGTVVGPPTHLRFFGALFGGFSPRNFPLRYRKEGEKIGHMAAVVLRVACGRGGHGHGVRKGAGVLRSSGTWYLRMRAHGTGQKFLTPTLIHYNEQESFQASTTLAKIAAIDKPIEGRAVPKPAGLLYIQEHHGLF